MSGQSPTQEGHALWCGAIRLAAINMNGQMFTQEWYETADESALLGFVHRYGAEDSAYLASNCPAPYNPTRVYIIKDNTVFLTNKLVLKYLRKFGYTEL